MTPKKKPAAVEGTANRRNEKKPDGAVAGFCAYIGPSIRGVIQYGTIYPGDRRTVLAEITHVVERYPQVAALVVDGATLPVDRMKVKTPGNLLYVRYMQLISEHQ